MVSIGNAIRELRNELALSQRGAAEEIGISHVHLNNLENGKAAPTTSVLDKFFAAWGIDLYMYAVVKDDDKERIPAALRPVIGRLESAWKKEIAAAIRRRTQRESH
jgi:transcriptional regulator with XRE-family HTH domain